MQQLLQLFTWLPLVAFLAVLLTPKKRERIISNLAISMLTFYLAGCISFVLVWLLNGADVLDIKHMTLYTNSDFDFFISYYFDAATAVYSFVGGLIALLVTLFSKTYMHREAGFKRYFASLLLFFLGYNLVIFSGNFETLFIGWEILGICSFLLIAFYRDRYLPVKNSLKVISVYRLGDVCLMLAMWMCHHVFHENITYNQLNDATFISNQLAEHAPQLVFIAIMIVVAAAAKSAIIPFSSWLPRAMEGPTSSSAVFYGSLSIHLGIFLLIRTWPMWEHITSVKILVIIAGLATSLVATSIARVQSTVKTQIAYSSISQIGLMFIEVAAGFHTLALIHFTANAFLRTYQLLVSPSVLNHEIHKMFFHFTPGVPGKHPSPYQKLKNAFYILSLKEWNMDWLMYRFLWNPFKWAGKRLAFLNGKTGRVILCLLFAGGLLSFSIEEKIPKHIDHSITMLFSGLALLMILKAFSERKDAITAWFQVMAGQLFITLSIALNDYLPVNDVLLYLGTILVSGAIGYGCLNKIRKIDNDILLNRYHGYSHDKPVIAFIFLLCCLGLVGFPFTPTFIGIDVLFTHIHKDQVLLLVTTSLSFIFIELAILRLYARIFLGQHKRNDHPIAFRSS
jgi:NADH:ubiquinone oxidoreductase subunit 5 (subunit L)/multisubunit Na+/H+ antiporter MnhA subunit